MKLQNQGSKINIYIYERKLLVEYCCFELKKVSKIYTLESRI